jgi:HK97 family phage portal protein
MGGSSNAYRLAVMDAKISKFEVITMKPVDAQFLESINATDMQIANFFGMPAYKLNMGKQSYESNEQQDLDYLKTTLDPYLVQWEQAAALRWLSEAEQNYTYFRFNRDVILRTDAKTRTGILKDKIQSGQMTPNEARQIEDMPAYEGGDAHYIPANMAMVGADGTLIGGTKSSGTEQGGTQT